MKNKTILILSIFLVSAIGFILWQNFFDDGTDEPVVLEDIETDRGENVGSENPSPDSGASEVLQLTPQSAEELIVGPWQSVDDEQSMLYFQTGDEMRHVYADDTVDELGTYQVFSSGSSLPHEISELGENIGGSGIYLRQSFGVEDYYYLIDKLDQTTLSLFYLPRGNILEYRKMD